MNNISPNNSLGPPIGTCYSSYSEVKNLFNKISNCGHSHYSLVNKATGETCNLPIYCDNRICPNPECEKHRLYKYMKKHESQINEINKSMIKPKAWVFTTPRKPYPIDREFCRNRYKLLMNLLNKKEHPSYGSLSKYSIHMEIKPKPPNNRYPYETWYLHFHVVSSSIDNLRLIRKLWGYQIKYEYAISPKNLAYYVSKYATKKPSFPSKESLFQYALTVYKLKMHGFSCKGNNSKIKNDWVLYDIKDMNKINIPFYEMQQYFDNYKFQGG